MPRDSVTRSLLAALAIALVPGPASAAPAGPSHANDPRIEAAVDAYLRPLIDLAVFQGAVLIARGERIVLAKGYGFANIELGVPNTPGRVFRIASLSKPFTEVVLGCLVEQKRLALGDPLSRYLPGFPRGDQITLEMLRTHRAGIPNTNSIPFDEEGSQPNTLDSLVRAIAREPLTFDPGTRRRYSNGGYALLGSVIEKVTGKSYADALQEAVARPLGLAHTRHEADQMLVSNRAYGYTVSAEERHALKLAPFQEMTTKTGGGSLVSTVGDLHRFLRAVYGDNVIRADTWRMLFPPDSVWEYQGRCPGYNVYMTRDLLRDIDVVVLCNNYAAGMVGSVGADLVAIGRGLAVAPPRWRADLRADSLRARAWIGAYRAAPGQLPYGEGPFRVRWRQGELVMLRDQTPVDVLVPQGGDTFLLRNLWSEMRFLPASESGSAGATLRPLWLQADPVACERIPEPPPGK